MFDEMIYEGPKVDNQKLKINRTNSVRMGNLDQNMKPVDGGFYIVIWFGHNPKLYMNDAKEEDEVQSMSRRDTRRPWWMIRGRKYDPINQSVM